MEWGAVAIALGSGTAGAFLREGLQFWRDRRKLAIADRSGLASAAHELAEGATDVVGLYQQLLDRALEQERRHCDQRIAALERKIEALQERIRELEHQSQEKSP